MTPATLLAMVSCALAPVGAQPRPAQAATEPPLAHLADSLFRHADYAGALGAYERLIRCDSGNAAVWMRIGYASAALQRDERAALAFEQAAAASPAPAAMYNAAAAHARLGRTDVALAWLDRAARSGLVSASALRADADFAAVRADRRFGAILARVDANFAPCATDPRSRAFDFWLGEWDVRNAQGGAAGHSSIQRTSGGCALQESWTDAQGGTGRSLNAFNRAEGMWQQFWVGQDGTVTEYRESEWVSGTLRFLARDKAIEGARTLRRMTFAPLGPDLVRQLGEQSRDGGRTWVPTFDLYYHRQP